MYEKTQPLLIATPADAGLRLDSFVAVRLGVGRRAAARLTQGARVNGRPVAKGRLLAAGDEVHLRAARESETLLSGAPEVLEEHPDVLVLAKPAGLPSVALAGLTGPSTARWLAQRHGECHGIGRPGEHGLVHRLDNQTSGLLLAARSEEAYHRLRDQFRDHAVEKSYLALVGGEIERSFTVDAPIGQHRKSRTRVRCLNTSEHPRYKITPAKTQVRALARAGGMTLIEARTSTGARHQIRAHLAHAGHALVGDGQYEGTSVDGLAAHLLHAWTLRWPQTGDSGARSANCPLPEAWRPALIELTGEDLVSEIGAP